jgi:hypothetical protein
MVSGADAMGRARAGVLCDWNEGSGSVVPGFMNEGA